MQAADIKAQMKKENQVAADWLIYYRARKRSHDERREEMLRSTGGKPENIGGSRSSLPGRPVESMVCRLAEHDASDTARWLRVVESVQAIIGPKKRQLLELRQECRFYMSPDGGRPGWIAPVQQRFGELTGDCPAENKIREMWYEIVGLAVRIAAILNCKF